MYKCKNRKPEFDLLCRVYFLIDVQHASLACSKLDSIYMYLVEFTWQKGSFLNAF